MNINRKNNIFGFSIIEIIVYLAIFTALSVVVINSFIIILSSFSSIRTNQNLLDSGSVAMDRISREIRQAKNIDVANSITDTLQLNSTDNSNNNIVIKFMKVNNALNLYKDGNLIGNLLAPNIILNSISFDRITTANSEGVKIKIILHDSRDKTNKTESYYDTVVLRGGY
jgi:type II secretory pathway pseudopilin PulG